MATDFEKVLQQITEKYNKNNTEEDSFIKSGSVILDAVISGGQGIPRKKFIQISSDSGLGKTTIVLHCARVACAEGKHVVYLDIEKGVNDDQLRGIGLLDYLNTRFFLYPVSTFEEAEGLIDTILDDPDLAYIIIDSITALVPQKLLEKSVGEFEPGIFSRYAGMFLQKYKALLERSSGKATFIFINQMRNKINFMRGSTFDAAGGNAQKYYMDIRLMMSSKERLEKTVETMEGKKSVVYGSNVNIWADKNRYNRPNLIGVITVLYGKGVSNLAAYQRVLASKGIIVQKGAGYYSINLPNQEPISARGADGVTKVIGEHLQEVKDFIEESGGIKLILDEDE